MVSSADDRVYQLWDELAAFPSAEIERAWRHLAQTLADWVGANSAFWVANVRLAHGRRARGDKLFGWRVKVVDFLHPPTKKERLAARKQLTNKLADPGLCTIAAIRGSGTFRVHRLHDGFVDLDALRKTEYYRINYTDLGIGDQMWVGSPISPETEGYFVFSRGDGKQFSDADAALAGVTLRGLTWFHRQMFYSHGLLIAQEPLTPTQRVVLHRLLSDKSEKQIADGMGQSFHTTHRHVVEIFRKFNVKSRAGLMAVWLS
jgi:DNA-binding CsgD family transcriptional regulator